MAGHLSNKTWYNKQRPYIRLNGFGDYIPGSIVFRERSPKDGTWVQLGSINHCCSGTNDSYVVVQNSTASANITSIASTDGRINWTGTLANTHTIVFMIPGGIDEVIQFALDTPAGRTFTSTTIQGNGVISPSSISAAVTVTEISTTAVPNSQYLVILS